MRVKYQPFLANPVFRLSDEHWNTIQRASNLSEAARPLLDDALSVYRLSGDIPSLETARQSLKAAQTSLDTAVRDLDVVDGNPRAMMPLRGWAHQILETKANMRGLSARFGEVASRTTGKPGAHERSVRISLLVAFLDQIYLDFTGEHIGRTSKRGGSLDFPIEVCRIGDPSITRSSIEEALKKLQRTRRLDHKPR